MENLIEIEYNERAIDALNEHALASIELGEWVYVWIGGEENKDIAHKIADGDMQIEDAMKALEYAFNMEPKVWIKAVDKQADTTIYILAPKFLGVFASHLQVYIGSVCKCGSPIGIGVICNAPMPWDCLHSTVIVCAKCSEEIAKLSPIHGDGWGGIITLREFEALREMVVVTDGDEA